jgi:hypothetical protein
MIEYACEKYFKLTIPKRQHMWCSKLGIMVILLFIFEVSGQSEIGIPTIKIDKIGLQKKLALPYCTYVGMYIFAQDQNNQYLGFITDNQNNTESIINDYGTYGGIYSTKSIRNQYSSYGSAYSSYSAYNEYTSTPPIIYTYSSVASKYTAVAFLTKNTYKTPAIDPDLLIGTLKAGCSTTPTTVRDLIVDSLSCVTIGDSVHVRFITLNSGNVNITTPFKIGLYNNSILLTYWNSTAILSAGYFYTTTYSFKPAVQTNVIKAFVDYDNLIAEDYEYNNTLSKTVYANLQTDTTDLKIDSLRVWFSKDTMWFTFHMLNSGNTTIPKGIQTTIYLNGSLDLTTDSTADMLLPQYYYPYSFFETNFSKVNMRVRVCIDATSKVAEFNENNNCDSGNVNIPFTGVNKNAISHRLSSKPLISYNSKSIIISCIEYPITLSIIDISGKVIFSKDINNSNVFTIPLNSLVSANGMYICVLKRNSLTIDSKVINFSK